MQQDESQEVENRALARLKQAAKNSKSTVDKNGVHSSNLVSLTGGSPRVKVRTVQYSTVQYRYTEPVFQDRKRSGGSRSDMEVSDDDNSDLRDSFLEESYPPAPTPWGNGQYSTSVQYRSTEPVLQVPRPRCLVRRGSPPRPLS